MPTHSVIDDDTFQAYLETEYRVHSTEELTLRIGEHNATLAAMHRQYGVCCSAYLTAWNPFSRRTNDTSNKARQQKLVAEIQRHGLSFMTGLGQHPSNQWSGEPSILVFGLGPDMACEIGRTFEQNAIVLNDSSAKPELVLLR